MTIENILRKKGSAVERIAPRTTTKLAIDRMREKNISALVVVDDDEILDIVSERDILQALARHGKSPAALMVEDAMSGAMVTITLGDSVRRAMRLMTQHRVRHLPVMRDRLLVGIVSIGDVVKDRLEDLEIETNVLRDAYIARR